MFDNADVERKVLAVMRILGSSQEPLGARVIAGRLKERGIELGERAVRYHLKLMDERGLTRLIGRRDGRVLTERGIDEIGSARVKDKVGLVISKIELLSFRTNFDYRKRAGWVPVNISLFPRESFGEALKKMKPAFDAGLCVSSLVAAADEGERLGELVVPRGKKALGTVCSIIINGTLLKAGVPMDSRFGGILQIRNRVPMRFVELIHYSGCSLDPSEIFIRAGMTSVCEVAEKGEGRVLGNFREIPAMCRPLAQDIIEGLGQAGFRGLLLMGETSANVCEVTVEPNKVGLVLLGGLNPVAAAREAGIEAENRAMSTIVDYRSLVRFEELAGLPGLPVSTGAGYSSGI
ncbi:MAG: DUF128 domain-containing protein [Chloroflexi bacterium]|nr:DUF128 domain-containing protein [Chloroflexota bacterium]